MENLRTNLRRRVGAYKGRYDAEMLDVNFKAIFQRIQRELRLEEYDIAKIIDMASDKQIVRMHDGLTEFQMGF